MKDFKEFKPLIKLMKDESIQYLIKIGIQGVMRVLANNAYTESTKVENELNEFEMENNPNDKQLGRLKNKLLSIAKID